MFEKNKKILTLKFELHSVKSVGMVWCSVLLYAVGIAQGKVGYNVGSDAATISWSHGADANLRLQRLDKERSLAVTENGRNGKHTFAQLEPGASYRLDVTPQGRSWKLLIRALVKNF